MRKRYAVICSLVLLALIVGSALWSISGSTAQKGRQIAANNGPSNPLVAINKKARAAKAGNEAATRELVDEMFRSTDFAQEFAELDEALKDRLVRAELNHRKGRGNSSGSEYRIVHAVNLLAKRLGTPDYTRTNVYEVRRLRADLLPYMPDIQEGRSKHEVRKGAKQNTLMSPLETFFVAVTLIQQKRHNPEYQLTNDEWIELHGLQRSAAGNKKFSDAMQQRRLDSKRTDEVRQAVTAGLSAMNPFDMLSLPGELLNTLGIEN